MAENDPKSLMDLVAAGRTLFFRLLRRQTFIKSVASSSCLSPPLLTQLSIQLLKANAQF